MANEETKAPVKAVEETKAPVKAAKETKAPVADGITYDGTEKKQGEKVVTEAFGVVIETNY
jgi:hypothetical protein